MWRGAERRAWNHNSHYHAHLLSLVPGDCVQALDVGCGTGTFARKLSLRAKRVVAIDRDAEALSRARERSSGIENLEFREGDFLSWSGEGAYDFVSMIATLHHLPFDRALLHAATLLRPGGVLAVLGLHANRSLRDLAPSLVAFPVSRFYRLTRGSAAIEAPMRDPEMTLAEIRREAHQLLPGCVVRRHLLWRYSLVWRKPES